MVLDVKGFEVVSSMGEPVWFGGVKLVTSPNAVPEGDRERAERMVEWMKKWIRYKCLLRRARADQRNRKEQSASQKEHETSLPTPAQRQGLKGCTQTQVIPVPASVSLSRASQTSATTDAMWGDFDLDADVGDVDIPQAWTEPQPQSQDQQPQLVSLSQNQLQDAKAKETQPTQHTHSGSDPEESGLSDYERQRRRHKRKPPHEPATNQPMASVEANPVEVPTVSRAISTTPSATTKRKRKRPSAIAAL